MPTAKRRWNVQQATHGRQYGEDNQGNGHRGRRLMQVASLLGRTPEFTEERQRQHAEHVKGGKQRTEETKHPKQFTFGERMGQYFVFGEKTRKRWYPCDSDRCDKHGEIRNGQVLFQTAHAAHVLFVAHGVDYRASPQKQQCLEKRVGDDVEKSTRERTDT